MIQSMRLSVFVSALSAVSVATGWLIAKTHNSPCEGSSIFTAETAETAERKPRPTGGRMIQSMRLSVFVSALSAVSAVILSNRPPGRR